MCVCVRTPLTSARIIFDQELIQRHPATSDSHHHRAAQDPHQTQLLRVTELISERSRKPGEEKEE